LKGKQRVALHRAVAQARGTECARRLAAFLTERHRGDFFLFFHSLEIPAENACF
jgi:hypothetical protein